MLTSSRKWESPADSRKKQGVRFERRAVGGVRAGILILPTAAWSKPENRPLARRVLSEERRRGEPTSRALDQPCLHPPQEIFPIRLGLLERLGIIAEFQRNFLQKQLDGILGLKTLRDESADSWREALGIGSAESSEMVGALVVAEFSRRQPV